MRNIWTVLFFLALSADCFAQVSVKGYYRKDGTYVAPHIRSSPDSYKWNNYGPSSSSPEYLGKGHVTSPYTRDIDRDGIANLLDFDDNNDGIHDDGLNYRGALTSNTLPKLDQLNNGLQQQPNITTNKFDKIPAVVAQLLLSNSKASGLYNSSQNGHITFVEHFNANGSTLLINTQGNITDNANGAWGVLGDSVCFTYSSQDTICYDFRLMPNGIGVFDKSGLLSATITKIENAEFSFDYDNGRSFTPQKLSEAKALLRKMKKFDAK